MQDGHTSDDTASWSVSQAPGKQSVINMRLTDGALRQVTVRVRMSASAIAELAQIISDFGQEPTRAEER